MSRLSRRSFIRTCSAATILGLAARQAAAGDVAGEHSKKIDKLVRAKLLDEGPGLAALVVSEGEITHARGYGYADVDAERRITTRTPFDLASVSKQFTAMAVMILAERGRLGLRDDVRRFLPELPVFNARRPIRITDLLHHTSGLSDYMELWDGTDEEFEKLPNSGVLKLVAMNKLGHPTGTKYEYSNTNYALLATIVERAAKQSFARFQAQEIFRPLGMTDSYVYDGTARPSPLIARGYKRDGDDFEPVSSPSVIVGDGNQFSSLEDMAKWDAGLRAHKLVSEKMQRQAYTAGKLDDGEQHSYGFGWRDTENDDHPAVMHNGSWAGTSTYICRYLTNDVTIALLSNDEALDADELGDEIAELHR